MKLKAPAKVILSKQLVIFGNSEASINDISLAFDGTVQNDAVRNRINTNINYTSKKFPIPSALALIPPSYQSYTEGMDITGIASSYGKITGYYNDSVMPLMDLHIVVYDGTFKYSALPFPLSDMKGECVFYSDITHDDITYFRIDQFSAKTARSSFSTKGLINHLFSDILIDLTSTANYLDLTELAPMIPADMKVKIKGSATGSVRTIFTMEMLDKMALDKMKFSGSFALSNFDVLYDSIYMKTDYSKVDFALPNPNTSSINTKYLFTKISSKSIDAGIINGPKAFMANALVSLETSDVMDSTKLPDVKCSFAIDSLTAIMDTIKVLRSQGLAAILP